MGGTTAVAPLYHAVEGLRLLLDVGIEEVRRDSLSKTARCLDHADRMGVRVQSPRDAERRGPMVILDLPGAETVAQALKQDRVHVDSRKNRLLRLAPFVWNTEQEIDRAFDSLNERLRGQDFRSPAARPGPVP
jgi:kynureninase